MLAPRLAVGSAVPPGPLQLQAAYLMAYLDLIGGGDMAHAKLALRAFGSAPWLTLPWKAQRRWASWFSDVLTVGVVCGVCHFL